MKHNHLNIAHISDLHLNSFYSESNYEKIEFILNFIKKKNVDHLVVTGDIVDNASSLDLQSIRELFQKYNLLDRSKLSVVVGNHDIFGSAQTAEDLLQFPDRCSKTDYDAKLSEFILTFRETFDDCIYTSKNGFFPYAKMINNNLIIGLNSVARFSVIKNPFASNGEINGEQLSELHSILKDYRNEAKNIILLVHHHFYKPKNMKGLTFSGLWQNVEKRTMKLRKKKRIINLLNKFQVDLVLHGHVHEEADYEKRNIHFLNAGASIKGLKGKQLLINFIEISGKQINTSTHKIKFEKSVDRRDDNENHYKHEKEFEESEIF